MERHEDAALFERMRAELFTAVVGDILDTLGLLHQFLPPNIRPLRDDMVVIGRAMPVVEADLRLSEETQTAFRTTGKPFGLMLEALDDLKSNEVYIATGSATPYALWGELMSTRALRLGCAARCWTATREIRAASWR